MLDMRGTDTCRKPPDPAKAHGATIRQNEYSTTTQIESPDPRVPAEEHRRKTKV
jgi:hypothetical protein